MTNVVVISRAILLALLLVCGAAQADSIPLIRENGTFLVPVAINDKITLNFTIDSGASDVSIPADVFATLMRTGTVTQSDFLDKQVYELADGSKQTSQRFRIRSLRIGSLELRAVIASVAPSAGTLLLGQSFLSRLRSWSIDNDRQLLVFESRNKDDAPAAGRPELGSGTGIAQAPISSSPMGTDSHAAYCADVLRNNISLEESAIASLNDSTASNLPDTGAMRAMQAKMEATTRRLKAEIAANRAKLQRLSLYLLLRVSDKNVIGIASAKSEAKNDWDRGMAAASGCTECAASSDSGTISQCVDECATRAMPDYPSVKQKRASCENLEWLPF